MVEVLIIRHRRGPGIRYNVGQRVSMPKDKAQAAVNSGWAKFVEKQAAPKTTRHKATSPQAETRKTAVKPKASATKRAPAKKPRTSATKKRAPAKKKK